jgi:hypothetical protein
LLLIISNFTNNTLKCHNLKQNRYRDCPPKKATFCLSKRSYTHN